jgi:hypothetical protein
MQVHEQKASRTAYNDGLAMLSHWRKPAPRRHIRMHSAVPAVFVESPDNAGTFLPPIELLRINITLTF